jgi:hypothetical protein
MVSILYRPNKFPYEYTRGAIHDHIIPVSGRGSKKKGGGFE